MDGWMEGWRGGEFDWGASEEGETAGVRLSMHQRGNAALQIC